jgi:hypothetical protein
VQPSGLSDGMTNSDDAFDVTRNLAASGGPVVNLSDFSEIWTQQKSPGRCRGLSLLDIRGKSVTGDAQTAKTVVHAYGDHVHILADPISRTSKQRIHNRE